MKNYKSLIWFMATFTLIMLVLTACSSSSSGDSKFPTGKFVSTEDQSLGYIFNGDMSWEYRYRGTTGAVGTYKIEGNHWIEQGTEECPFPGTYEWSFDGSKLSFQLVGEDECVPRREATDGQTFQLVQ